MHEPRPAGPAAATNPAPPAGPRLRAEAITLTQGGRRLLDGVDLDLAGGGITMVLGPNGAGKSLLLKVLHGLIAPDTGRVLWDGRPAGQATRRRQAMVFQRPVLLRRSAAANIDFVLRARGRRDRARRDALLAHVGLDAHASRPARRLSGGEQQRLALARALATGPELLFLDEPTASLDPASVLRIEQVVAAARADDTGVVFVTHDVGQARRLADDIVFLHRGRVVEHAPAARFFDAPASAAARDFLAGRIVV
ncbi:ABC transporter ATP-binding protein [Rhodobacteraceae bacterium WD3A24]|nr:ABC transporter ATP-binding protein [Rhodobacteraceae bacterium WD3A24]